MIYRKIIFMSGSSLLFQLYPTRNKMCTSLYVKAKFTIGMEIIACQHQKLCLIDRHFKDAKNNRKQKNIVENNT